MDVWCKRKFCHVWQLCSRRRHGKHNNVLVECLPKHGSATLARSFNLTLDKFVKVTMGWGKMMTMCENMGKGNHLKKKENGWMFEKTRHMFEKTFTYLNQHQHVWKNVYMSKTTSTCTMVKFPSSYPISFVFP